MDGAGGSDGVKLGGIGRTWDFGERDARDSARKASGHWLLVVSEIDQDGLETIESLLAVSSDLKARVSD
jgi:hypothetical protein